MTYELVLDRFLPVSVNRLLRMHPTRRHRAVAADAQLVGAMAKLQGVPPAGCKRRVSVRFEQPRGRLADADNRCKALLDQLVMCQLLNDDGPSWCELGEVESVRGERRRTVVTLEDLE